VNHAPKPSECPHHTCHPRGNRPIFRAKRTLAKRYGVSAETIRKWRKRGASECQDRSARPHHLPWKATEEERAVVCAVRQSTNFPLDDLTFVITNFLPHLNRDSIWPERVNDSETASLRD
jgi:transposase-like protein